MSLIEPFLYQTMIREHHLDLFGHVNHAVYLQLLEEARWEWLTQRNYGLQQVRETGVGPIVVEIKVRFRRELLLRDMITIETVCLNARSRIATFKQTIRNQAGVICAEAEIRGCLFDTHQRKVVEPDARWLAALGFQRSE